MALTRPDSSPRLSLRVRLALYRFALLALSALIAVLGVYAALNAGIAHHPHYTDQLPLSLVDTLRLLSGVGGGLVGVAALVVVFALTLDLLLTAGALAAVLRPDELGNTSLKALLGVGARHLTRFLRILFLCVVLCGLSSLALGAVFHRLGIAAARAHRDLVYQALTLGGIRAALGLITFSLVGAFGLVCRALVVADQRRVIRRAAWLSLRACVKRPRLVGRRLRGSF